MFKLWTYLVAMCFVALLLSHFGLFGHQTSPALVYSGNTSQPVTTAAPTPTPIGQPITPAIPATSGVSNLEDFRVIRDGSADGVWQFQLDARQVWQTLPITFSDGNQIEFTAKGQVCGGPNVGCVSPNGQLGPAKTSTYNHDEFPVGEAFALALVGRIGSYQFQVGNHKVYQVPTGMGNQSIQLMDNYRLPYITLASGGFVVQVTIRKP